MMRNKLIAILTTGIVIQVICTIMYLSFIEASNTAFYVLIVQTIIFLVVFIKIFLRIRKISTDKDVREIWRMGILAPTIYGVVVGLWFFPFY
jgi:hypothetical protein